MGRYVVRRLIQSIPVIFGISIITFLAASLAPGDPVAIMVLNTSGQAMVEGTNLDQLRAAYGLDQPLPIRYLAWLNGILHGNLGQRLGGGGVTVLDEILHRLPATFELTLTALAIAFLVGVPLGVLCAVKRNTWIDYSLTAWTYLGVSIPGFFVGMVCIYVFAFGMGLFPTGGYYSLQIRLGPPQPWYVYAWDHFRHLVLPALVLAWETIAGVSRYTRNSVLDTLSADYVVTAHGKGLQQRAVMMRHVLRNALLPVITLFALRIPGLFSGALLIETLFNWPGMGTLANLGIQLRDYPLIMGINLFASTLVLLSNILADVAYAIADPRIHYK